MSDKAIAVHQPCADCGSSDALAQYENHTFCFSCNKLTWNKDRDWGNNVYEVDTKLNAKSFRGLTKDTVKAYSVGVSEDGNTHHYPYYTDKGAVVATKIRNVIKKDFFSQGNISDAGLFGQQLFKSGGKYITLTEGEIDAMSAYQMLGSKWPVVSIKNGAKSAVKNVKQHFEYLDSFDNIVITFDMDEQGKEAAEKVAQLFSPRKAKIVSLPVKDANECLTKNLQKDFVSSWWNAKTYIPDGILASSSMIDTLAEDDNIESVPYPWEGVNRITDGLRLSEMVIITAETGVGKTSVLREILYHLLKNTEERVGTLFLEETPKISSVGLTAMEADIPAHKFKAVLKSEDRVEFGKRILGDDRVYFYDSFGSMEIDNLMAKIRYYAKGLDCRFVILDHISIVVSDGRNGADERKLLDEIATKLKTLTMELNIGLIAVVHVNRQGQIRGTAGIEQLANMVIGLKRDKLSEDEIERNTTDVVVWKNRWTGETGTACHLYYDPMTGRMTERDLSDVSDVDEQENTDS